MVEKFIGGNGDLKPTVQPEDEINWNVVRLIVEKYSERFGFEMAGCIEYVKQKKAEKGPMNDYALVQGSKSDGDVNRRYLYEMPSRLHAALSMKYPLLLKGDNLRRFLKEYPIFCIADKL